MLDHDRFQKLMTTLRSARGPFDGFRFVTLIFFYYSVSVSQWSAAMLLPQRETVGGVLRVMQEESRPLPFMQSMQFGNVHSASACP